MIRRKGRNPAQHIKPQIAIEMTVNMINHPLHPQQISGVDCVDGRHRELPR
jgi:hypothetical protein